MRSGSVVRRPAETPTPCARRIRGFAGDPAVWAWAAAALLALVPLRAVLA